MRLPAFVLASALAVSGLAALPARAEVLQPSGQPCMSRGLLRDGMWRYVVTGGPVQLTDEDDPSVVRTGTITCSLVDAEDGDDHTVSPWFTATSGPGTAPVLPPTVATNNAPFARHHLCTRIDVEDGPALYWHQPPDRNAHGVWSTVPDVRCTPNFSTLDWRIEDFPHGYAVFAALAAVAEAEEGMAVAIDAACSVPAVADAIEDVWTCDDDYASTIYAISFARVPGGAVLRSAPPTGWTCTDVHTGDPVGRGSALTVPNPGVRCDVSPSLGVECNWVHVTGVLAPATLGRVAITNACGDLSVTRTFAPAAGRVAEVWSGNYTGGQPPVYCTAKDDAAHGGVLSYVAHCNVS